MTIHSNISEINENQWQRLVNKSQTATFFQTLECYEFYASLSFLKPFVFGVTENEKLVGVICGYIITTGTSIQKWLSSRAIIPGGPLLDPNISTESLKSLLDTTRETLSKKAIYIHIQNYKDYSEFRLIFKSARFDYMPYLNFYVPTYDVPTAFGRLNDALQKQVKLAAKAGVEWSQSSDKEDVKAFYNKLKKMHRKNPVTNLFPLEFFEKLILIQNAKLFVVKHRRKLVGGMFCVILPGNTMYEWYIYDEDEPVLGKEIYAGTVVNWAGIEYAAKTNIHRLEFMNFAKPTSDLKAREYKRKFGGQSVELGRFMCVNKPVLYFLGKFVMENIIKKIGGSW